MSNKDVKDDYSYWSENLHSAYLFYTMEVDKLNKQNNRLREALEDFYKIADDGQAMIKKHNDYNGKIYGLGYLQDIKDRIYNIKQAMKGE